MRNTDMKTPARALEHKEDKGKGKPDTDLTTKEALKDFMGDWDQYKSDNDDRLKEIEKKGKADPLLDEKLARIDESMDKYESLNKRLTSAEAVSVEIKKIDERFDVIDIMLKRAGNLQNDPEEKAGRVADWARAVHSASSVGVVNLPENQQKVLNDILEEYKALNVSTNTEGGYLAPIEFIREIIKAETELSPVRTLARVRQTGLRSIELPKRTGQFAAQWVVEQGTKSETEGLTYGIEEINTHELYALIDITNQMLEDNIFNIESEIETESSEQFALAEGASFVTGSGIGQPEGFMTNTDVETTVSGAATTITADGLLTLKYAIKTAYTGNANWVMNRTTMGSVRKLKDSNGQYLWMPGIAQGRPNSIDGDPYVEMIDMPSEGAGLKPVAYGDFRRAYTWVDRLAMEMLRDPYTQATAGKVRHILRKRVAGKVTLAEAIRTLTCST